MSVRGKFPQQRPTLNLNFAQSKILDPRITFTRTSTATYVDEDGLIKVADADVARFDHDPVTGECLGLLIEEQRVNYETNTEDPTQWTISNMIPTGNSVILPTGQVSTTVEYQGETTDPNSKIIRPLPSGSGITAGDTWCFSIFLKAGTEDTVNINMQNNTATEGVRVNSFNMLTGEDNGIIINGDATNGEFGAISYPNGWWRVYIRGTFANDANGMQTFIRLQGFSNQVSVTTSFSAWGAQLEKASFMTSYIPRPDASTATRTTDNASITGSNFTEWYNQSGGTIKAEYSYSSINTQNYCPFSFDNGTNQEVLVEANFTPNGDRVLSSTGGVSQANTGIYYYNIGENIKRTIGYKLNDFGTSVNGSSVFLDNTYIPPNPTQLCIGHAGYFNSSRINGHIKNLQYYPNRLSNSQLITLTK